MYHAREKRKFKVLQRKIGKGAHGVIYLAKDISSNEEVIAKKIDLIERGKTFAQEVYIMKKLNHPNIVKFLGYKKYKNSGYIFMEKIDGDNLFNFVLSEGRGAGINQKLAIDIFWDIINGVEYLHQVKVSHLDLKTENVIYDKKIGIAKIVDFGLSVQFNDNKLVESNAGSPLYSAPEVLLNLPHDPRLSEVWSLGVILFFMIHGSFPWSNVVTYSELVNTVIQGKISIPSYISPPIRDILERMFEVDPRYRITLSDLKRIVYEIKISLPEAR